MSDDGVEYQLVLKFDSDDPEFVRGFELGQLWAKLDMSEGPIVKHGEALPPPSAAFAPVVPYLDFEFEFSQLMHASNAEMVMRMCEKTKRNFRAIPAGETFVVVFIGAAA